MADTATASALVALVTGGTAGFGRAIVEDLAARGMRVAVNGRNADRGAAIVEGIRARGGEALWLPCDVQDSVAVQAAVARVIERYGRLDLVVPAASLYEVGCVTEVSAEQWRAILDTTLSGAFHVLQAAWPQLRRVGRGRVVTLGCVGAERVYHGTHTVPYRIAVNGLYALTKAYAQLGAPHGITVNMLALGFLAGSATVPPPMAPIGRSSPPEDILPTLHFLLSDAAAHVNGACINVAGGYVT